MLMRDGGVVAQGLLRDTITADNLSKAFGLSLRLTALDGRYHAQG
jgi:iron complex transport system ATP-binding protein